MVSELTACGITANAAAAIVLVAYTAVDTGSSLSNPEKFIEARFAAVAHGSELTTWVVRPAIAEALSKLKELSSGSNKNLIDFVEDGLKVVGLPVLVSDQVDSNTSRNSASAHAGWPAVTR